MQVYLEVSNIILTALLSAAIFNMKAKESRWISLILVALGFYSIVRLGFLIENRFIIRYLPMLALPLMATLGPAVLTYANKILLGDRRLRWKRYLIAPTVIFLSWGAMLVFFPGDMTVPGIIARDGIHKPYTNIVGLFLSGYTLVFMGITCQRLFKYNKTSKEKFSSNIFQNTKWLFYFVVTLLTLLLCYMTAALYILFQNIEIPPFTPAEGFMFLLLQLYFVYYLITKPEIVTVDIYSEPAPEKKYAKVNLPDETRKGFARKLEDHMANHQAFLEEDLTVGQVAEALDIPQHHISMAINIEFGQNFYQYVNRHRVKFAEKLLKDPNESGETVLGIGFRSGFKSKSTFNKAFKTVTNMTPTQYRKQHSA